MLENVGELIATNGEAHTSVFTVGNTAPGELRVDHFESLSSSDQGIYTCRIPLRSGEMREISIGIYPNGFNGGS